MMNNLICIPPAEVLLHGPTKMYVSGYVWHSPQVGIVASYTPTAANVEDHFGLFRGVDQIEAFAQATVVSCGAYNECKKQNISFAELKQKYNPVFISIGQVKFHGYIQEGEQFISIGQIQFYKFRQIVCDGRIYKVPAGFDINAYFSHYTEQQLLQYELPEGFTLVAELFEVTGRALKKLT
ncbi:hypothetical protein [Mucilaginibacter sp.]